MDSQATQSETSSAARLRDPRFRRRRILIFGLAVGVLVALGAVAVKVAGRPQPIRIAFANSLTGPIASAGTEALHTTQLYLDEVNRQGGIDGRPVELSIFDDQSLVSAGITNVKPIADGPFLAVLGHFLSTVSLAAGPGYRDAQIPAITGTALADGITTDNAWYFRTCSPNRVLASWTAEYVRHIMQGETTITSRAAAINLVISDDGFGRSFSQGYIHGSGDTPPKSFVLDAAPDGYQASLRATVDAIAEEPEPRIIVIGAVISYTSDLIKAIRRRGIHSIIVSGTAAISDAIEYFKDEPEERDTPGFFTENLYAPAAELFDSASAKAQQFAIHYKSAIGINPSPGATTVDASVRILIEALRRAHPANTAASKADDRQKVREALLSIYDRASSVQGLEGPLYFDSNRDIPRSLRMATFRDNKIISAPLQLVEVENPTLVDLDRAMADHEMIQIEDQYYWLQRVVFAGIDVNHVDRVDARDGSFKADVYLWMRYGGEGDEPIHVEFPDLKDASAFDPARPLVALRKNDLNYRLFRISGDFKANFDLHDYPFDTQELVIRFQNGRLPHEQIAYAVDTFGLRTNDQLQQSAAGTDAFADLQLWRPIEVRHFIHSFSIGSTLGNPDLFATQSRTEYGGLDAAIVIRRDFVAFMVKTLMPLFLLILVVFATLFFPNSLAKERTTIPVTGILTSAVLMISINSQLPPVGYTFAIEYLFYIFFGLCLMAMVSGFMGERMRHARKPHLADWFDISVRVSYVLIVLSTFGVFWWKYAARA